MISVFAVNLTVIAITVMIHYEFLFRFTNLMPHLKMRHRFRIVLGVFAALTAHALEEDRERAMEAGCDDYATKPVDFPALLEKIRALATA